MTREEKIKKLRLRGLDLPVRVNLVGGKFCFYRRGFVYGGIETLKDAVKLIDRLVREENKTYHV